jgi:hypothetical protein
MRSIILSIAALVLGTDFNLRAEDTVWWMPDLKTYTCHAATDQAVQFNDPNMVSPDAATHEAGYLGEQTFKDAKGNVNSVIVTIKLSNGHQIQVPYFVSVDACKNFAKAIAQGRANLER